MPPRKRSPYIGVALAVLLFGLLTRPARHILPAIVTGNLGDALYALMAYFLIAILFPKLPPLRVFAVAFAFCALVEFGQLYRADWLNAIRHTTLGGLVLGYGFSPTDLGAYFVGAGLGAIGERQLNSRKRTKP